MTRTRLIVLVAVLLAFAAGGGVGMLLHDPAEVTPPREGNPLEHALDLSPPQRERMREIWEETVLQVGASHAERRRQLGQERDDAIASLLSPQQQLAYEQIQQEYAEGLEELSEQRRQAFEEAMIRTRELLTAEQAERFEQAMSRRGDRDRGRGPAPGPGPWPGPDWRDRGGRPPDGRRGDREEDRSHDRAIDTAGDQDAPGVQE